MVLRGYFRLSAKTSFPAVLREPSGHMVETLRFLHMKHLLFPNEPSPHPDQSCQINITASQLSLKIQLDQLLLLLFPCLMKKKFSAMFLGANCSEGSFSPSFRVIIFLWNQQLSTSHSYLCMTCTVGSFWIVFVFVSSLYFPQSD